MGPNRYSPLGFYKVIGKSMEPAYSEGDYLIVNRIAFYFRKPKKGEAVLLEDPRTGKVILKRIQAVKKQRYYVLGDNKNQSTDSRAFGWVPSEKILGNVLWRISRD
ncbi:MAG: nickel-type superoxide dismutase maturation protease [Nanoarchaeota archaeon]